MNKSILIVGGLDPSGGAGIAADLRMAGHFKISTRLVITCLAVQNDRKFFKLVPLSKAAILKQLRAACAMPISAIKIGALGNLSAWPDILRFLRRLKVPIVLDPVFKTSSGGFLVQPQSSAVIRRAFLKLASHVDLLTPNLPEAHFLLQKKLSPEACAMELSELLGCSFLLKGGHAGHSKSRLVTDFFWTGKNVKPLNHARRNFESTRGTGCMLATAIACELAQGKALPNAVSLGLREFLRDKTT